MGYYYGYPVVPTPPPPSNSQKKFPTGQPGLAPEATSPKLFAAPSYFNASGRLQFKSRAKKATTCFPHPSLISLVTTWGGKSALPDQIKGKKELGSC